MTGNCPDPTRCPVVDPARLTGARTTTLTRMGVWRRVYESKWGYDEFHPGSGGDSRFAPFKDSAGTPVPTLYLAESDVAALLETVFHDLEPTGRRLIYEAHLRERSIVTVALPKPAVLLDLRDPELARLGVARSEVASSPSEHYACTRAIAAAAHGRPDAVQGIVWHSRQTELASLPPAQVVVLFGDRFGHGRGKRHLAGTGATGLVASPGRDVVDQIAVDLGATIVPLP